MLGGLAGVKGALEEDLRREGLEVGWRAESLTVEGSQVVGEEEARRSLFGAVVSIRESVVVECSQAPARSQ